MQNKILYITTTSGIEGAKIDKYLGIVTTQAVQGTNIFSDMFAEVRDVVGGYSASYQNKLKLMEDRVILDLKQKAIRVGANAIIGLRLDFDEISGKGKGMLMLTAQGTAVRILESEEQAQRRDPDKISFEFLDFEVNKQRILERIESGEHKINDLDAISNLGYYGIGNFKILVKYLIEQGISIKENAELLEEYMSVVELQQISDYLVSDDFLKLNLFNTKKILSLMEFVDWFDFNTIDYLLRHENSMAHWKALLLLGFQKSEYSLEDIPLIEKLNMQLEETFRNYPRLKTKQGMFGKQKEYWECVLCGDENEKEFSYCYNANCGANYYGMKDKSVTPRALINDWNLKAELIKKLLG